ncbi:PaREP1 family protein [Caldivirga sp. UBA161]|uniref:PaREP1 family protein n=1 Tax=Caldivirga sp. UBA161 TaxID=1915569 RepID=UPI0025C20549|nr:PaREP1 family protein [Caldivirga sp. UBA161]
MLPERIGKPWRNLRAYIEARRIEALAEAKLAIRLLAEGYTRNAAGKAFQAFKSLLAALAGERREELANALSRVDKLIAYMPTSAIRSIAKLLGLEGEAIIALALHQYQYNGVDPEGVMSVYASKDEAIKDICSLLTRIAEALNDEELKVELQNTCLRR